MTETILGIQCEKRFVICGDGRKDVELTFTVPGWEKCTVLGYRAAKRCIKGRLDAAVRNTLGIDKEENNVQI